MMKKLILGSTSPYRKTLLEKLHVTFSCDKPNVDESPLPDETPLALVKRLAIAKAQTVAPSHEHALIISSDQVAVFNDAILGKPHTKENAIKQLQSFSGQTVTFLTSLCVLDTSTKQYKVIVEPVNVFFRTLTIEQITYYIETEQPLDCAGSFKSEGLGISLFKKLECNDPNALIGLPLIQLTQLLQNFGVDLLSQSGKCVDVSKT